MPTASRGGRGQHFPSRWPHTSVTWQALPLLPGGVGGGRSPTASRVAGGSASSGLCGHSGELVTSHLGAPGSGGLTHRSFCGPWTPCPMFPVSCRPLRGWGLGASSALSLAEQAGISGWSSVLPNLLAVPQGPASCLLSPPCYPGWRDPRGSACSGFRV